MLMALKRTLLAVQIASAALLPVTVQAAPLCQQMSGWVWLTVDPSCQILRELPENAYLAQAGVPNTCFSVYLYTDTTGLLPGKGSAGLTSEKMTAPTSGVVQTPTFLNEAGVTPIPNEFGAPETRRFLTARSVLKLNDGKLFTADAIMAGSDGKVSEQIVVTGGTGTYTNAKGSFYLQGRTIDNWGRLQGELCYTQ